MTGAPVPPRVMRRGRALRMHGPCRGSAQWGAAPAPRLPEQPSQSPCEQLRKRRSGWGPTPIVASSSAPALAAAISWLLLPLEVHMPTRPPPRSRRCSAGASGQPEAAVAGQPGALLFSTQASLSLGAPGPAPPRLVVLWQDSEKPGTSLGEGNKEN